MRPFLPVSFLLFFSLAAFLTAGEWQEYAPLPLLDDVSVDPLRYTQGAAFVNLSDPAFKVFQHGQSAVGNVSPKSTKGKLVVDFEFRGREGLEYLSIRTPLKIEKPGYSIGGKFSTDLARGGSIRVRLVDPSGEFHQQTLGAPNAYPIFAPIERMTGAWGGDGDKELQFPCTVESIILDRPVAGFRGKGTLEITELALYEPSELRDVLKLEFAAGMPQGLLFDGKGTLKFRLTPKSLRDGEKLLYHMEFRDAGAGALVAAPRTKGLPTAKIPFLDLAGSRWNDKSYTTGFDAPSEISSSGLVVALPITAPGAARIVIVPKIQDASGKIRNAMPVFFSFGAVKPKAPIDERCGVCTHYQQWWPLDSLPMIAKAGIGMLRDEMSWGRVEPKKGTYALPARFDEYVDMGKKFGIDSLVILDYSNRFYDEGNYPTSDEAVAGFAGYSGTIASRFKGRVKYYEIWNEWSGGCGMRHVKEKTTNTPENYVKLLKATEKVVRAADPEAYIVGGGGDHSRHHLPQIEAMFKAGALQYCDAFSIHPYRQPRTPEESELVKEVVHVAELMKRYGVKEPKLWLTEIGWPTPKTHPAVDAELFQAMMLIRSVVPLLATGVVERYIWYDFKNDGLDRIDQEHNFGLIRNDKLALQIKPAYIAYATLTRHTAGTTLHKDEKRSSEKDGIHVYRLQKENAPDILVLWCVEGFKNIVLDTEVISACNMFGTPLVPPRPGETWRISGEPVWLTCR